MTSWSHTATFNGGPPEYTPKGPGSSVYAGGGSPGSSNTATVNEQITYTGTWVPAAGTNTPPPASVVVAVGTQASCDSIVNGKVQPGTDANDGYYDPINPTSCIASGTHYKVETGSSFTINLSLEASDTNFNGFAYASVGGVSVSVLSGGWDGPYYFHYGNYYNNDNNNPTPWAANTAAETPTPGETPDGTNTFTLAVTSSFQCNCTGCITPVWIWTGPNLNQTPPRFSYTSVSTAFSRDFNDIAQSAGNDDGQGNTPQPEPMGAFEFQDTETDYVSVETDNYAPDEGPTYWALGTTVHVTGQIDNEGVDTTSYNLLAMVELYATISSGSGG